MRWLFQAMRSGSQGVSGHNPGMQPSIARAGSALFCAAILLGTLMPGPWRDAAARPFELTLDLGLVAHVVLFAGLCLQLPFTRWWAMAWWHVPAIGLGLALLTEGLQSFVPGRHPNLAGVLQDLAGTLMGWVAARTWQARLAARTA